MSTIRRRQADHGFALASAIFILVVLAALAVGITLLTTQSQTGLARDLLGSRAYHAARAGLDWGAYRVLDPLNTTATSGSAAVAELSRRRDQHLSDGCRPAFRDRADEPVCLDGAGGSYRHAAMLVHRPHGGRPQHPRVSAQIDRHVRKRSDRRGAPALGSRRLLPRSQRQPREPASLRVQLMRCALAHCAAALPRPAPAALWRARARPQANGNWSTSGTWNVRAVPATPGRRRRRHRERPHRDGERGNAAADSLTINAGQQLHVLTISGGFTLTVTRQRDLHRPTNNINQAHRRLAAEHAS